MSALGDVLSGIKKVLLIEESVARIEKDIEKVATDLRRTRDYAEAIDGRVRRLEGFIEGVAAASGQQTRLPKE
jgi:TPP-dependent indolepyruvate ferredoxin oxidoreductase alpha subunit